MTVNNLEKEDHFMICNQYSAGEFKYLGNNVALHVNSRQQVKFNGHTAVEKIVIGEMTDIKLLQ